MKWERFLLVFLFVAVMYLLFDKFNVDFPKNAIAQETDENVVTATKEYTMKMRSMLLKKLDAEEVNANKVRVLGHDVLQMNVDLLNLLKEYGSITYADGKKILDDNKIKTSSKGESK